MNLNPHLPRQILEPNPEDGEIIPFYSFSLKSALLPGEILQGRQDAACTQQTAKTCTEGGMPEVNTGAEGVRENTKQPTRSSTVHAYTFSESRNRGRTVAPSENESGEHAGKHALNAGPWGLPCPARVCQQQAAAVGV